MKIKALFLLFLFLLNLAVGLNCALQKNDDCCKDAAERISVVSIPNQTDHLSRTSVAQTDACCQNAVNDFASLAKLVPQSIKVLMPVSVEIIQPARVNTFILAPVIQTVHQSLIDKRRRPPTPDIRIVIQSFQI